MYSTVEVLLGRSNCPKKAEREHEACPRLRDEQPYWRHRSAYAEGFGAPSRVRFDAARRNRPERENFSCSLQRLVTNEF